MTLRPRTLYSKISLSFAFIVLALTVLQFLVLYFFWTKAEQERMQRVNWGLAAAAARELRPVAEEGNPDSLLKAIGRIKQLNPEVDIFLLGRDGRPILARQDEAFPVPPELIEDFLRPEVSRTVPLFGPNPFGRPEAVAFSAARFHWNKKPAYLYIPLLSRRSKVFGNALSDWYLMSRGGLSIGLIFVFAVVLGTLLFRMITRRFRMLTGVVTEISRGDLDARIEVHGSDEIAELGGRINGMADRISGMLHERAENDQRRRDMIANVSHDLRGPVASLRAHAELIAEKAGIASAEQRLSVEAVILNAERLGIFIDQLFELSRLEAKEAEIQPEPFSVLDLISEELLPQYKTRAQQKNITLEADLPETAPRTRADLHMIYRVLANLLENALHAVPPGGKIELSVAEQDGKLQVAVSDTGSGIRLAELPHIFDRFYSGSKSGPGSGLGLAIVKRILDLHGAPIRVSSREGQGTTFSFELPEHQEEIRPF